MESENQPTKPPQHPPTLSSRSTAKAPHATSQSAALPASTAASSAVATSRRPQQRPIHPPTTKRNVCASMSEYVCVCECWLCRQHLRQCVRVCVCVLNFNFSLLFLVRRSRCRRRRRRSLRSCSFIRSVRSFGLFGSRSVCTVRWFSWNFAFDLVGCVSCIALCEQRKNTENCKEVVEAKKATKCKRSAEHRNKKKRKRHRKRFYTQKNIQFIPAQQIKKNTKIK